MKWRSSIILAVIAVGVGLAGVSATGCTNLDVGASVQPGDSTPDPGLDDGGSQEGPGASVVPIGESNLRLEQPDR